MKSSTTMHVDVSLSNLEESIIPFLIYPKIFHQGLLPKPNIPLPWKLARTSHGTHHECEFRAKPVIVES